jgi:hypothetical protein
MDRLPSSRTIVNTFKALSRRADPFFNERNPDSRWYNVDSLMPENFKVRYIGDFRYGKPHKVSENSTYNVKLRNR